MWHVCTTYWLDHVVCTSDAKDCTTHIEVMYDGVFSDNHYPRLVKEDLNIMAEFEQEHSSYLKRNINWDKLPLKVVTLYKQYTNDGFSSITLPHGVKCTNHNCSCPNHANAIDQLYDNIINVLSKCSENLKSDKRISKTCTFLGGMTQ